MTNPRVLIAGGGIAGLALARALRDHGLDPDVVERVVATGAAGAGLYLPANAVRALDDLGFGIALKRIAHPIVRQRVADHRGRVLMDHRLASLWDEVGECVAVSRADLHRMLVEGTADVAVRRGVAITTVADGMVAFDDGTTARYDLVVGADGVHSTVRGQRAAGTRPVGLVAWRYIANGPVEEGTWSAWQGPDRTFLAVSLGAGRAYCYADADIAACGRPGSDWRELFAGFAEPVRALVALGAGAHVSPIEEVGPVPAVSGRSVLIGDAAHALSPSLAQGAAMALEDAIVLADLIASRPVGDALAEYEQRRAPRIAWVRSRTHRVDRARHLPQPVRDTVLRLAGRRILRASLRPLHEQP